MTPHEALDKFSSLLPLLNESAIFQGQQLRQYPDSLPSDDGQTTECLKTLGSQATFLVRACCEHLQAFTESAQKGDASIAPFACVRASLESAAIATWLTDRSVDRKERIARSFAFRHEGLVQQRKCLPDRRQAERQKVDSRISAVEHSATNMGYVAIRDPKDNSKIKGIATQWPGSTAIVKESLSMETEYRLLSAVTHGHSWAILQMGYKDAPKQGFAERHLNSTALHWLCLTGTICLATCFWSTFTFTGAPHQSIKSVLDELYDKMAVALSRPWD